MELATVLISQITFFSKTEHEKKAVISLLLKIVYRIIDWAYTCSIPRRDKNLSIRPNAGGSGATEFAVWPTGEMLSATLYNLVPASPPLEWRVGSLLGSLQCENTK